MKSKAVVNSSVLYGKDEIARAVRRLATEIVERNRGAEDVVLLGIRRRGDVLAERIASEIRTLEQVDVPVGYLDITLYRDDVGTRLDQPVLHKTEIMFPIDDRTVVLTDDVLYTGRTVRAALTAVIDLGRARRIQLAVLCDRGGRELPVAPDYVGFTVAARKNEQVLVLLSDLDGEEGIKVFKENGES